MHCKLHDRGATMKLNDFRIGWRTLVQEPAYSLVVILGLGVGLAASLQLFGFVQYSWLYDAAVPDADQVGGDDLDRVQQV